MKIILEDQALRDYAKTDDAVKAFTSAVNNGQARLAMEILVPIIQQIASSIITEDESDPTKHESTNAPSETVKAPSVKKPARKIDDTLAEEDKTEN